MTKRLTAAERKAQLLDIGAKLAAKHGAKNVTRRMVAAAARPPIAESLVSASVGNNNVAQKLYAKRAKQLGLTEPTKEQQVLIGTKLRAHGQRKVEAVPRKRSVREVKAIKRAVETKPTAPLKAPAKRQPATKPAAPANTPTSGPSERKTAFRQPKAAPASASMA